MNILQVNSSARSTGSHSTELAGKVSKRLQAIHSEATLAVRDLSRNPHRALDETALQALFTPSEQRTSEQAARVALDDTLIEEVQSANIIVLGVPMYNFGVSSQLKNWIDAIARAGVTFRYTNQGPEGLLINKKIYIALARGGIYRNTPNDTQVPYLKAVLGFLGLKDVEFVYAEGLAMGPEAEKQAMASAHAQIEELVTA